MSPDESAALEAVGVGGEAALLDLDRKQPQE
jgi:hypothetical protein